MKSYFIFKGTNSDHYGIILEKAPEIQRGEERVNSIIIPGRAGDLTVLEGDDIYNPYVQPVTIAVKTENLTAVRAWLRGSGFVTFSNESEKKQMARVMEGVQFEKVSPNLEWYRAEIPFYCQPIKQPMADATQSIASGASIQNNGDVTMKPKFVLTGSGNMSISVLQKTLDIASVPSGGCIVDSETEMVTNAAGTTVLNASASGEYPVIPVGNFAVTYTGATGCTITKRIRYL